MRKKIESNQKQSFTEHDNAWKDILNKRYFPYFLKFYFPDIYEDIDFNKKFEFLDKEFQRIVKENEIGDKRADKLIKVFLKDGSEQWLLIHIEIQGYYEKNFEERLYIYNYRIFDRYNKEVITLAILTDENDKFRPHKYEVKRWGFRLGFEFPIIKIIDFKDKIKNIEKSVNPFAVVTLTYLRLMETKNDNNKKLFWKKTLVKSLFRKGFTRNDIIELYNFIDWIVTLPKDLEIKFRDDIIKFEEAKKMPRITNIQKIGFEEGMEKKAIETAIKMLNRNMEIKIISELTGLSEKEIKELKNTIKKAA